MKKKPRKEKPRRWTGWGVVDNNGTHLASFKDYGDTIIYAQKFGYKLEVIKVKIEEVK